MYCQAIAASSRRRARLGCLGDVGGLQAFGALSDLELDLLTLFQRPESFTGDRRVVDEHVLAVLLADEAEPFLRVEPLHVTNCHSRSSSLRRFGSSSREGALPHTT